MAPFILLYLYLFLIWFMTRTITKEKKRKQYQTVLSFLGLLFLLGFHDPSIGTDMGAYIPAFQSREPRFSLNPDIVYGFEPGFVNYLSLIKYFTNNEQAFLFISAIVILFPVLWLIKSYSKNTMFSIIIYTSWYLYYFSFSGLRQAIAVSICVLATLCLLKKKLIPYIVIVVLASSIHTSALFFIIAYPLYWLKMPTRIQLLVFIVLLLVLLFFKDIIVTVANLVFGADNRYSGHIQSSSFGGYTIAIVYLCFGVFQIYHNKQHSNPYIPFLLLITILQFTGVYSQTIPRIAYYFLPIFALSFPEALSNINNKNRPMYTCAFVMLFVTFFFMQASSHYLEVTPFKFFWE